MSEYTPDALFHTYITQLQHSRRALTTISRTSQTMFHAGINAYRQLLTTTWDNLTDQEALTELRRGQDSMFWPLFMDDPRITIFCDGHCKRPTVIDNQGICFDCGWELE